MQCADIARRQGARRFLVISALGARVGSASFYSHVKGETERDLKAIGFETLDILRPSVIVGDRDEDRPAEEWAARALSFFRFLLIGPLRRYRPIRAEQIAKAMSQIALQAHQGAVVHTSDQLSMY